MLVEFHTAGISTFMLADVSNHDVEDVRAMYLESTLAPVNAADLYQKLPVVLPMDPEDVLRPARKDEIQKKGVGHTNIMMLLNPEKLLEMPTWKWDQIFKLLEPETE